MRIDQTFKFTICLQVTIDVVLGCIAKSRYNNSDSLQMMIGYR